MSLTWRLRPTYAERQRNEAGVSPLRPRVEDPHAVIRPFGGETSGRRDDFVDRTDVEAVARASLPRVPFGDHGALLARLALDHAALVHQSVGPPLTEAASAGRAARDVVERYLRDRFELSGSESRLRSLLAPYGDDRLHRRVAAGEGASPRRAQEIGVTAEALIHIVLKLQAD